MNPVARYGLAVLCAVLAALGTPGIADAKPVTRERPAGKAADSAPALPQHLRDTGLYVTGSTTQVRPENLPFSPQYPLWSDGAAKRRWLYLPPGTAIDAARPDAWAFPPGTRLWKEFGHGRLVETRFIERLADGSWRYATYIWNAEGNDAVLAPAGGVRALPVAAAPGGRYEIPAEADCRACHEGAAVPVLGVSALQLSPERDPLAPHAEPAQAAHLDLRGLVARGLLRNLPVALLTDPPRVPAATPVERAALGYLHANCSHCHNDAGPLASLDLALAQGSADRGASAARVLRSLFGESRYRPHSPQGTSAGTGTSTPTSTAATAQRITPGRADASVLALRMRSRNPLVQMPPLGTQIPDAEGLALIERWIHHQPPP